MDFVIQESESIVISNKNTYGVNLVPPIRMSQDVGSRLLIGEGFYMTQGSNNAFLL